MEKSAHKLTSSQAIESWLPNASGMSVSLLVAFLACGCQGNTMPPASSHRVEAEPLEFDAGVLFAGESNYLCIPFERLGLASSAEITSVETSCECVKGSVVSYLMPNGTTARALRLDIALVARSEDSESVPMLLSVQVSLAIANGGGERKFSVNLIHSVQDAGRTAVRAGATTMLHSGVMAWRILQICFANRGKLSGHPQPEDGAFEMPVA